MISLNAKLHSFMAHLQMLTLLETVHVNVGDYTKKFMQENEKLEAATLAICTTTAKEPEPKFRLWKSSSVIVGTIRSTKSEFLLIGSILSKPDKKRILITLFQSN